MRVFQWQHGAKCEGKNPLQKGNIRGLKNGASVVPTLGPWGVGLQWVGFSQETKLLKLAANSSTMERRAAKGIFNLSSDRYRQSVQHRPNSNTTEK